VVNNLVESLLPHKDRCFHCVHSGLSHYADYDESVYWINLTSPEGVNDGIFELFEVDFMNLLREKLFNSEYVDIPYILVLTSEGNGVIHAFIRCDGLTKSLVGNIWAKIHQGYISCTKVGKTEKDCFKLANYVSRGQKDKFVGFRSNNWYVVNIDSEYL